MAKERLQMYAKLMSAGLYGINAYLVSVETDLSKGLPGFDVVGLPDAAVKESRRAKQERQRLPPSGSSAIFSAKTANFS